MIILDGRNFYPQDVEDVIQQDRQSSAWLGRRLLLSMRTRSDCWVQELARGVELTEEAFILLTRKVRAELLMRSASLCMTWCDRAGLFS